LQNRRIVAGNIVELRASEPLLPDRDSAPGGDDNRQAEQAHGEQRPDLRHARPLANCLGQVMHAVAGPYRQD